MEKNLKNIKQSFKDAGIFYTPPELAEMIRSYVPGTPKRAYDPTCGQGNLLAVFGDNVEKFGQELFQDELDKASARLSNFHGYCGDTLADDGFKGEVFDCIVANPPFSTKWDPREDERWSSAPCLAPPSRADYAFVLHCLHHLSEDGRAVIMEFPGILYRAQREGKIRQWLVDSNVIERVVHVPGGTFVDTSIATCILVLSKCKDTTDIIFENKELCQERIVTLDEVKANQYTLSVTTYVRAEEVRPVIDPVAVEMSARAGLLKKLESELRLTVLTGLFEHMDADAFIDDVIAIAERYRTGAEGWKAIRDTDFCVQTMNTVA